MIEKVKELLKEEMLDSLTEPGCSVLPILHNEEKIILQFCGWSINLLANGTWYWESTEGG